MNSTTPCATLDRESNDLSMDLRHAGDERDVASTRGASRVLIGGAPTSPGVLSRSGLSVAEVRDTLPELVLIERESIVRQSQQVARYLNELPRRQREIIYLKYYQNLDREEIAEVMGISHQSVSNLLQKALLALRRVIPVDLALILVGFLVA